MSRLPTGRIGRSVGITRGNPDFPSRPFDIRRSFRFYLIGIGLCSFGVDFGSGSISPGFCLYLFGVKVGIGRLGFRRDSRFGGFGARFGDLVGLLSGFFDGVLLIFDDVQGDVLPVFDLRLLLVAAGEKKERDATKTEEKLLKKDERRRAWFHEIYFPPVRHLPPWGITPIEGESPVSIGLHNWSPVIFTPGPEEALLNSLRVIRRDSRKSGRKIF